MMQTQTNGQPPDDALTVQLKTAQLALAKAQLAKMEGGQREAACLHQIQLHIGDTIASVSVDTLNLGVLLGSSRLSPGGDVIDEATGACSFDGSLHLIDDDKPTDVDDLRKIVLKLALSVGEFGQRLDAIDSAVAA